MSERTPEVLDPSTLEQLRSLISDTAEPGEDVAGDLLRTFKDDAKTRVAALREAISGGDHGQAAEEAHALKGAAATLGAERVRLFCLLIEQQCHAKAAGEQLLGSIDALEAEIQRANTELKVALTAHD
jgi:HPt (histidine-containing phosphotransfer) domain-containing protein